MRSGAQLRIFMALVYAALVVAGLSGCTSNSSKKHYVLAEKLWTDGKYSSAVVEFDKVTAKDPKGQLGLQAQYRSATTQSLFLFQYNDAVRKFKAYAESSAADPALAWEAQQQIGEILYSKTEQYDRAIQHYQGLLKQKPTSPDAPEFSFRIAKSHFFLWKFDEAVTFYRQIITRYPKTIWAEKAAFEVGVTEYTRSEQRTGDGHDSPKSNESYKGATEAFQSFIRLYPQSALIPQAKFGIAACLEELDKLDAAYAAFEALKTTYPSPNVIAIRLARIRERQAQRSR